VGVHIKWVATIWGLAVGIIIMDVLYYLTDNVTVFVLAFPFAIIGYFMGNRYQRKIDSEKEILRKRR
jgi:hypothetical protein